MRAPSPLLTRAPQQLPTQKHFLRQRQREVLSEMIRSAVPPGGASPLARSDGLERSDGTAFDPAAANAASTVWRLLIFDDWGRDIIAPLLKVSDLRELGVTLYMHINTERDPVPGAPALYFCAPTADNIARIAQDCGQALYEWVYLNFTAQVPRQMLELLATRLRDAGLTSIQHIQVFDRTLSYTALEDDLFSLMLPNSYLQLNRQGALERQIEAHLDAIVLGITHVLLAQQLLPVVVHSKTGPAREVARRLSQRLTDAIAERQLMPNSLAGYGRPVLLLVDRASDLATALHHPFTYRGLLVDVGKMHLNKCTVRNAEGQDEVLEVDPDRDVFYHHNASLDFSAIGGNIEAALRQYKAEYTALAAESAGDGGDGLEGALDDGSLAGGGDANTVSRLLASAPRLAERKRFLDTHTKLAYSFLQSIRQRSLDRFHGVELGVLQHEGLDRDEFARLLDNNSGTVEDRQRLCLVTFLLCHGDRAHSSEDEALVQQRLAGMSEADFPALRYLRHLRQWSLGGTAAGAAQGGGSSSSPGSPGFDAWGFAQHIAKNIASSLGTSTDPELPLTKLVAALLQDGPAMSPRPGTGSAGTAAGGGSGASLHARNNSSNNAAGGGSGNANGMSNSNYHPNPASPLAGNGGPGSAGAGGLRHRLLDTVEAYDPRTGRPVELAEARFSHAIVFALGGGSVVEYDNLKAWEATRPRKAVSYGCTSLTSGDEMLYQLSTLGAEMAAHN